MNIYTFIELIVEKLQNYFSSPSSYTKMSIIVAPLCFTLDFFYRGKDSSLSRALKFKKSFRFDFYIFLLDLTKVFPLITVFMAFGLNLIAVRYFKSLSDLRVLDQVSNPFVQILLHFVVIDFLGYLYHRAAHKFTPLWELHKFHHSATELNFITSGRRHPLEQATKQILIALPSAFLGVPVQNYLVIQFFLILSGYLHHSDYKWKFGLIGKYIFPSPYFHQIHHSINPEHYNSNYAARLVIWDRLFGSYYKGNKTPDSFGVDGFQLDNKSLVSVLWTTTKESIVTLFLKRKTPLNNPKRI